MAEGSASAAKQRSGPSPDAADRHRTNWPPAQLNGKSSTTCGSFELSRPKNGRSLRSKFFRSKRFDIRQRVRILCPPFLPPLMGGVGTSLFSLHHDTGWFG